MFFRVHPWRCLAVLVVCAQSAVAQTKATDPASPIDAAIAAAEQALRQDERQVAESRYRDALYRAWMLKGAVELADGHPTAARDAFAKATASAVDNDEALQALATMDLQLGDTEAAVGILTRLVAAHPKDQYRRRLLAQALIANRQMDEAVQALEEAHGAAPDDAETSFALATGYLRVKKVDAADRLLASVAAAKPVAQTYVLIGRAYRDAGQYERAEKALRHALAMDPRVKRAHYYLGMAAVMAEGTVRVDTAIAEFREELKITPDDPLVNMRLGMALVEARREREALAPLQIAARAPGADWQTFQYLGRCQQALGNAADAVKSVQRAIELAANVPAAAQTGNLHYQLAQAMRAAGDERGATAQFEAATKIAAEREQSHRDVLDRFMRDEGDAPGREAVPLTADTGPIGALAPDKRRALAARASGALVRAYQNLGIMQAQANHFDRAAGHFEDAAAIDPSSAQVQYLLGVAWFNLARYEKAAPALTKAVAADTANADARRMLALSCLEIEDYARAASLLRDDATRETDPSVQLAYGMALVKSGRVADAEALFQRLLTAHADSAELNLVLGEAHAEQGDYDGAVASLQRALAAKPDLAGANAALGIIYLKQGKLSDATKVLQAELAAHPADVKSRYTLATVLDLDRNPDAAVRELLTVLKARPEYANARYLFGKILLSQGRAEQAATELELAAKLAPDDPNVHYQLGQAYQRLGKQDVAQKEFDAYRALKDKRRGGGK